MLAIEQLEPEAVVLTPSYAAYLIEWAAERDLDLAASSVVRAARCGRAGRRRAGLPGEARGGLGRAGHRGDGHRRHRPVALGRVRGAGRHAPRRARLRPRRADRPRHGARVELDDGATGELVLTHLRHQAAPLLRFRTRDHVLVSMSACPCGRTGPRVRCLGRTDDMLIVRGVNVFPSAVREVVSAFAPARQRQRPRAADGRGRQAGAAAAGERRARPGCDAGRRPRRSIRERFRNVLVVQARVELVPWGSLQRSEYKSKLVETRPEGDG